MIKNERSEKFVRTNIILKGGKFILLVLASRRSHVSVIIALCPIGDEMVDQNVVTNAHSLHHTSHLDSVSPLDYAGLGLLFCRYIINIISSRCYYTGGGRGTTLGFIPDLRQHKVDFTYLSLITQILENLGKWYVHKGNVFFM